MSKRMRMSSLYLVAQIASRHDYGTRLLKISPVRKNQRTNVLKTCLKLFYFKTEIPKMIFASLQITIFANNLVPKNS